MRNFIVVACLIEAACTSPDKLIGDSNVFADPNDIPDGIPIPDTATEQMAVTLDAIQSGEIEEGTVVTVTDVVATTPSSDEGFFVGTPEGGANSGMWVQSDTNNKGAFDVLMGQVVTVTGTYRELVDDSSEQSGADNSLTALVVEAAGGVVITNEATDSMPPATTVTTELLSDPSQAEQYEGSYINLSSPTMIQEGDEMYLNGSLLFDETFVSFSYQYETLLSEALESVKGIVGYKNGQYVLHPCSESDVTFAQSNTASDLDGSKLFVSEVLAYNDELSECNDFNWYLEINYNALNVAALDVNTIYLKQVTSEDSFHAKLVSEAEITPESIMLISDGDVKDCLAACNDGAFSVLEMESVSGMSNGVPDIISAGDEISLYYASSEDNFADGNATLIDRIEIPESAMNTSVELAPDLNGIGTDGMSQVSGEWCESMSPLYLVDYSPVNDASGLPVNGSPGSVSTHCSYGLDTANTQN